MIAYRKKTLILHELNTTVRGVDSEISASIILINTSSGDGDFTDATADDEHFSVHTAATK